MLGKHLGFFYLEGEPEEEQPIKQMMQNRLFKGDIVEFPGNNKRFIVRSITWKFGHNNFIYWLGELGYD